MKKAAAKGKTRTKTRKPATKKHSRKPKKPADITEVRKEIAGLVTEAAPALTAAVVEEGRKGQLAPVKYLFEMAGLYPPPGGVQEKPEDAALAKTLLDRLGLSHEPVTTQEDDPASKVNLQGNTENEDCVGEQESDNGRSKSETQDHSGEDDVDVTVGSGSI